MNSNNIHPLEQEFKNQAPLFLDRNWIRHFLWISQTVELLRSLPKNPSFWNVLSELEKRNSFQVHVMWEENIPQDGPLIVAANHPFIFADRWAIWSTIEKNRLKSTIKIVAEDAARVLKEVEHLSEFIGNTLDERIHFKQRVDKLLQNNGTIIIYPGGQTTYRNIINGSVVENKWKKWVLHFAKQNDTPILPVHVDAKTSFLYNTLRNFFSRDVIRKLNLREINRKNIQVKLTIWPPIKGEEITSEELKDIIYWLS